MRLTLYFLLILSLFSTRQAQAQAAGPLADRNIPNAVKLHEDNSGSYYGALITSGGVHLWAAPSDERERKPVLMFAIRKPDSQGVIFETTTKVVDGQPVRQISENEIARFNKYLVSPFKKAFPDSEMAMIDLWTYLEGHHFQRIYRTDEPYYAEESLFVIRFFYDQKSNSYRPIYEHNNFYAPKLGGFPENDYKYFTVTVDSAKKARQLIASDVPGRKKKNLELFAQHEHILQLAREQRYQRILDLLNKSRREGIVYKSENFWSNYDKSDTLRNVLSGDFNTIEHPGLLASLYLSYVDGYYQACNDVMPSPKIFYKKKWREENKYGVTRNEGEYYVEMEERFYGKYKELQEIYDSYTGTQMLTALVTAFTNKDSKGGWTFVSNATKFSVGEIMDRSKVRAFIKNAGCRSATIKQLGDNLIQAVHGGQSVQDAGRVYTGAAQESLPYDINDAKAYYARHIRQKANNPKQGNNGWDYENESLETYTTGVYAEDAIFQNRELFQIAVQIANDGHPILRCQYGPTGIYSGGDYKYSEYIFWYDNFPPQFDEYMRVAAGKSKIYKGLNYARKNCPPNSNEAHTLIFGKK